MTKRYMVYGRTTSGGTVRLKGPMNPFRTAHDLVQRLNANKPEGWRFFFIRDEDSEVPALTELDCIVPGEVFGRHDFMSALDYMGLAVGGPGGVYRIGQRIVRGAEKNVLPLFASPDSGNWVASRLIYAGMEI